MADGTTLTDAKSMIAAALDAGQTVPGTRRDGAGQYCFDMAETNLWVARQTVGGELPDVASLTDDALTGLFYRALTIRFADPLYDKAGDVIDAVCGERARREVRAQAHRVAA